MATAVEKKSLNQQFGNADPPGWEFWILDQMDLLAEKPGMEEALAAAAREMNVDQGILTASISINYNCHFARMVEMKSAAMEFAQLLRYLGRSANAAKFWRGKKRYVHAAMMVYTFRAPFRLQENRRQRQAFTKRQEFYVQLRASRGF